MRKIRYDVIGYWSEVKLEIVKKYAAAYSSIMNKQSYIRSHLYIDAFAGAGKHISKRTGEFITGSPLNALNIQPPFSEFHLIDLDRGKAGELRSLVGDRKDIEVYEEDANDVLLEKVFPRCLYQDYRRGLCLLDPYKLNVDWKVIQTAGKMRSIEIFYNFMLMDANMNVLWRKPDRVSDVQSLRLDKAWGDHSWREIAYSKSPGLFGDFETKADNETVAEAFRERLQKVAGFKYVPPPLPMRNDQGSVIYYLYFASPNETGGGIVRDIFNKYRNEGKR
jgi:three-Cys-motif partner protein